MKEIINLRALQKDINNKTKIICSNKGRIQ